MADRKIFMIAVPLVLGALVGGCSYHREVVTPAASPETVVVTPGTRVVTYPEGRYELRGSGTTTSPYYWVWIPAGATVVTVPPPPAIPR